MLCDFCHENEAEMFVEQTTAKGIKKKINICRYCAQKRGVDPSNPNVSQAMLETLFNELVDSIKQIEKNNARCCPVCGKNLGSIRKSRSAGCPECYEVFKNEIQEMMFGKNQQQVYSGSLPQRISSFKSVLNDRVALQIKLDQAVKEENYEKAAMYRDYLKALEKSSVARGEDNNEN